MNDNLYDVESHQNERHRNWNPQRNGKGIRKEQADDSNSLIGIVKKQGKSLTTSVECPICNMVRSSELMLGVHIEQDHKSILNVILRLFVDPPFNLPLLEADINQQIQDRKFAQKDSTDLTFVLERIAKLKQLQVK